MRRNGETSPRSRAALRGALISDTLSLTDAGVESGPMHPACGLFRSAGRLLHGSAGWRRSWAV